MIVAKIRIKKHITLNLELCTSYDISYPEWILCEQIQFLSVRKGYCYAKRKTLAEALKISVRGLQKMIDRLIEKGLLKRHENAALTVTEKWLNSQEIKDSSHEQSSPLARTKFTPRHEQSSPPTIKMDNLSVDIKEEQYPEPLKEWIDYRKEIKKPLKESSIKRLLKKHDLDSHSFALSVDHSIENGYQGLFAPKTNKTYTKQDQLLDEMFPDETSGTIDVEVIT